MGDDRWRGGPSRQSSQRQSGNRDRAGGQGQGQGQGQGAGRGGNPAGNSNNNSTPSQDQHVPVKGFNAGEAKSLLKKVPFYKPTGKDANNQKSGGPWGAKANTMANGKDFFVELRKQVASLQRGGPPVGG
ncbi:hypothetical protein N7509_004012 [Penicillium cosmopolitanum]|uniref:Uncharacterized protein n=1 Tax=Penicillium cosmopolitanum TaxID=1131564 RepID=A0A9X0BBW8_9EURO|nr:uncharacterized protein N7509_004012 [Penicillium cosmopolitanum]KAJ5404141.1 hypothetical protein N7509_004012 [Penicillium cosmopolitanum]